MSMTMKWAAAAVGVAALAGCATYPYGYNGYAYDRSYDYRYDRPYYYGYDSGPYAYGPYYYGYPAYGPYYYGAPSVGLSFGFSGGGHHH